jgi:hypothetical protein
VKSSHCGRLVDGCEGCVVVESLSWSRSEVLNCSARENSLGGAQTPLARLAFKFSATSPNRTSSHSKKRRSLLAETEGLRAYGLYEAGNHYISPQLGLSGACS